MGGGFDQFYSFYSFLPSVEGSHQRRPFCWGRSELEGQSCDGHVHVHVQRKLQSSTATRRRRSSSCWNVPTQPGRQRNHAAHLCAADLCSFLPTLPSFSRLGLIFYLFCSSYPLLFPAATSILLASSHQTCALLGLHSRTPRLSWHPQPCRNINSSSRPPSDATTAAKQTERPRYFPPRWRLAARKASSPRDQGTKRCDPPRLPRPRASIMPFDNSRTRSLRLPLPALLPRTLIPRPMRKPTTGNPLPKSKRPSKRPSVMDHWMN